MRRRRKVTSWRRDEDIDLWILERSEWDAATGEGFDRIVDALTRVTHRAVLGFVGGLLRPKAPTKDAYGYRHKVNVGRRLVLIRQYWV